MQVFCDYGTVWLISVQKVTLKYRPITCMPVDYTWEDLSMGCPATKKMHNWRHITEQNVFGQPFVKRFTLCYRTIVCLSACPVCNVGVLSPNGWMDQDETWHGVGLGPGHIVLDGDPASPPQKGHSPSPNFAHVYCGQMAGWIKMPLGTKEGLDPGDTVLDGDPTPPKGAQPLPNFWAMSIVAKQLHASGCQLVWR